MRLLAASLVICALLAGCLGAEDGKPGFGIAPGAVFVYDLPLEKPARIQYTVLGEDGIISAYLMDPQEVPALKRAEPFQYHEQGSLDRVDGGSADVALEAGNWVIAFKCWSSEQCNFQMQLEKTEILS